VGFAHRKVWLIVNVWQMVGKAHPTEFDSL
jgi:hypothetical protein